jgi:hypothetical protein
MANPDPQRTLELVRPLFDYLHQRSNTKYKRDATDVFPFLDLFEVKSLSCPISGEPVIHPVVLACERGIMEQGLASEYSTGRLRMTNPVCYRLTPDSGKPTDLTRLAILSGGRFSKLLHFSANLGVTECYDDPSDELLIPPPVDINQLCARLPPGVFGIVSPTDLKGGNTSVLTLDERGWLAVFVGYQACGAPGSRFGLLEHDLI